MALLYALRHIKDKLGLRLHGAHLNHSLRGAASDADACFVAREFRRLNIGFTSEQADVKGFRLRQGLSPEEAAREVRYAFLAGVAAEQRADAVALGHTSDDQAETVLMHIIRGSGLSGLRGMEALTLRDNANGQVTLARPLLGVSRRETAEYCLALGLEPREDESNLSMKIGRNRVRLELIPQLESYNPAVKDALVRLSRSAALDMAYIQGHVDRSCEEALSESQGRVTLDRGAFSQLEPAIQGHVLRRAAQHAKGDLDDVEQNHIDDMARLMMGQAGKSLDLPGGIGFTVGYSEGVLARSGADPCPLPLLDGERKLEIPGETLLEGWRVNAKYAQAQAPRKKAAEPSRRMSGQCYTGVFDRERVGSQVWMRPRRPGDRFQPLGMSHTKKLQDFMVDSKIPRSWRERVPLLVTPRGIAWVAGWRIAEWARPGNDENTRLEVRISAR